MSPLETNLTWRSLRVSSYNVKKYLKYEKSFDLYEKMKNKYIIVSFFLKKIY